MLFSGTLESNLISTRCTSGRKAIAYHHLPAFPSDFTVLGPEKDNDHDGCNDLREFLSNVNPIVKDAAARAQVPRYTGGIDHAQQGVPEALTIMMFIIMGEEI